MKNGNILKKSIAGKIITFLILIGLIPLLSFGLISIVSTEDTLKSQEISAQQDNVRQSALYIDLVMSDVESLIANVSGINEIHDASSQESVDSAYSQLLTQEKIGSILSGYTNLKGLVSIDLFSVGGAHYHVGETLNITNVNSELRDMLNAKALNSSDFVSWVGIQKSLNLESEYSYVIIAVKMLNDDGDAPNSNGFGLLVVSYDPNVFNGELGRSAGDSGYSIIVDASQKIVYHPDSAYIGKALSSDLSAKLAGQPQGTFTQTVNGQPMLVVFGSTAKGGWKVARFIPLSSLYAKVKSRIIILVALLVFAVWAILHYGILISHQVARPIKKITETFRALQSGDFQNTAKLNIRTGDEISRLGELFNSFIDAQEDITTQKKLERQLNQQNQELNEALMKLKETQAQMVQQEKLAGIGQLAAGVAHEINNPLGYLIANSGMMGKYSIRLDNMMSTVNRLRQSQEISSIDLAAALNQAWIENRIDNARDDMKEIIEDTSEGLHRIEKIVTSLKSFSRINQPEERGPYDINQGIQTTLLVANNELKYTCDVSFTPGEVPIVDANGGQINQVLLNILVNAVHAITSRHGNQKGKIDIKTYAEDASVCCEIRDNGCGMTEDVMKRIFEPFFTTKPVGQGTGLGLGIAYDIVVNKHAGRLEVESVPGEGSCFHISLPLRSLEETEDVIS